MMRILHFSDAHENAVLSCSALFDKRLIGCANSLLIRRGIYHPERLDRMIDLILQERPDLAVFTGDAVSTSEPEEFHRAFHRFRKLLNSGIPLIAVPGNHDCYVKNGRCCRAMEEFYTALNGRPFQYVPYIREIGGIRFAVIHCARPTPWIMSSGTMTEETAAFLAREAEKPGPLVCIGHFPLLTERRPGAWRRKLYGAEPAAQLLKQGKIALSLCGHVHKGYERDGEVCAGSVSKFGTFAEIRYENGPFQILSRQLE